MEDRIEILNTKIDVLTMQQTIDKVEDYLINSTPLHLMGVNSDKINMVNKNERLKNIVNSCGIINADGASVVLASKYLGKPLPERVAGIDLMQHLVRLAAEKHYKIYLLGASQEVVEKTAENLVNENPNLMIAGVRNGYFTQDEWENVANDILNSEARIVFVGITSPLKEYLIDYFQHRGLTCVFMGVGGSFDVISGKIARAPLWMQKNNLEWLFRVMMEPTRLFKRYFVGNWQFIHAIYREKRLARQ